MGASLSQTSPVADDDFARAERRESRIVRIPRVSRQQLVRLATFWLRPAFVLRVVNRFQKVAGFDRAIALASSALTAVIPLTIFTSAFSSRLGGRGTADRIINR